MEETTLDINKFDPTVAELNLLVESYSTLSIKGIDDEEGYAAVKEAQGILAKQRIALEKTGKAMRDDALKFQRAVIAKEKELKGIIEQDGDGFLARVQGYDNLYARGTTKAQAQSGLVDVIDMTMDHYLQQAELR